MTSRFHFILPGLIVRDLDELPANDACNLLLHIAPRIDSAADEISRLCGRLPLALRLAGSALAERPNLSPADYARRLKEGKERFGPVEASLNLSYELLSEDLRRLWGLLAVFPGTFDAPAAAAIWDLELDPTSDALAELGRCSLVEFEEKDGRYRLHDLAQSFADRRLEGSEKEAVGRRHATHYVEVLRKADSLYREGGESVLLGLRLFDAEWDNIQGGQAWAATYFSEETGIARICEDYPTVGEFLLELRQHPRERIRWSDLALAAARQREDRNAQGLHLGSLGHAYADLDEPRRAIELYEQALAVTREIGDRLGEGNALGSLGIAYAALGEHRRAIEFYEQNLAIARELGDRRGEGNAMGAIGRGYASLGEPRRAIEIYEQWLAITREIGDRRGEGNALGNLGVAYKALGESRRAIKLYEQRLAIACEIGDRRSEGAVLGNLGLAYAALGEPSRAIALYGQHLSIAREIGDRLGEAYASWNLGLTLEKEGNLVHAADLMQILVDYEREVGHSDAEKDATRVAALRARIAEQSP